MTTLEILTGQDDSQLVPVPGTEHRLHREVLHPFVALREAAKTQGFEMQIISSYRGFATQLKIWNEKVTGLRPLLDAKSHPMNPKNMTPKQIVLAILRWSALPGASRHHWGTDFDVIDRAALTPGYQVQLTPEEAGPQGPFGKMHDWLDQHLPSTHFYRPYDLDRGGVSPERWHLSYWPVAQRFQEELTPEILGQLLHDADLELKTYVLSHLEEIFERYVSNVAEAP